MDEIKYYTLLAKHKETGEPIEGRLCSSFDGRTEGHTDGEVLDKDATTGLYTIVSCGKNEDFLLAHPDLWGFVPDEDDQRILAIVADPLLMNHTEARRLKRSPFWLGGM